jgi:hypothetical protein
MKRVALSILFLLSLTAVSAQSESYQTLRDHFTGQDDVHSFSISGLLCRAAMSMVIDEEDELMKKLVSDIDHVRFIVIPKQEFANQNLSVNGFKKFLVKDSFEEMMSVRDNGDHVTVFMREDGNKKNRYFVLVEEQHEVVAIEMKGYVDPELFKDGDNKITFNR